MFIKNCIITGSQLAAKWHVDLYNLSYIILKHDLSILDPPNNIFSKLFFDHQKFKLPPERVAEIIQRDPYELSNKLFLIAELENLRLDTEFLNQCRKVNRPVRTNEIRFSRGSIPPGQSPQPPDGSKNTDTKEKTSEGFLRDVIEAHDEDIKNRSNVFSLIGKFWFIKFKQKEWGLFPDQQKYKYIAHLLTLANNCDYDGNAEFSINNDDLYASVKRREIADYSEIDVDEKDELNLSSLSDKLSRDELDRFKDKGYDLLHKLKDAENSGNQRLVAEAKKYFQTYRSHLLNEYGIKTVVSKNEQDLFFKSLNRPPSELEKIRQLIKNHIANAKKDLQGRMPMLKKHFDENLKLKSYSTSYISEVHNNWHVSM